MTNTVSAASAGWALASAATRAATSIRHFRMAILSGRSAEEAKQFSMSGSPSGAKTIV
jgi:hypothetical protein